MRQMIKKHIQRLLEEQQSWLKLLAIEPPGTMYHAVLNLAIDWQIVKIEFWFALIGEKRDVSS